MYNQSKSNRDIYILCGGHSSRMGRDKRSLMLGDKTFLSHLEEKTASVFDEITILGANHQVDSSYQQIPDLITDAGPLGGLLAALQHTAHETIALLPVDLPQISESVLKYLRDMNLGENDAIIAKSISRLQPLVGIYKKSVLKRLMSYLQSGKRSVMGFIDVIEYSTFDVSEQDIININTPDDYDKLLKSLS